MEKKLYRKTNGQMICGVCNGLADYLKIDVTVIRILAVLSCIFGGGGLIVYIIAAVIMPVDNNGTSFYNNNNNYNNNNYNNSDNKNY